MTHEPITIPRRCQLAWDALNGRLDYALHLRRAGWYSTRDLFAVTGRPSTERKVRELRALGVVDWRRVPDHDSGGEFVEFKVAAEPGRGHEIKTNPAGGEGVLHRPVSQDASASAPGGRPPVSHHPALGDTSTPSGRTVAPAQAALFPVSQRAATREEFERTGKAVRG